MPSVSSWAFAEKNLKHIGRPGTEVTEVTELEPGSYRKEHQILRGRNSMRIISKNDPEQIELNWIT